MKTKCKFCGKEYVAINQHLSDMHNIGTEWFYCTQKDCDYKSKQKPKIKVHLREKHTRKCDILRGDAATLLAEIHS